MTETSKAILNSKIESLYLLEVLVFLARMDIPAHEDEPLIARVNVYEIIYWLILRRSMWFVIVYLYWLLCVRCESAFQIPIKDCVLWLWPDHIHMELYFYQTVWVWVWIWMCFFYYPPYIFRNFFFFFGSKIYSVCLKIDRARAKKVSKYEVKT